MSRILRRKTPSVPIGNIAIGSNQPVAIQSMTDTPTADRAATLAQTIALIKAGSELVRWTINDDAAAQAVPKIIKSLRQRGYAAPIIGDFHFNGHYLLSKYPAAAKALAKYRINPGNIGKGRQHDENFAAFIKTARQYNKPVRIGVNWGSLDEELKTRLLQRNSRSRHPQDSNVIMRQTMVASALESADYARALGLKANQIVLSVKMSGLQDMVAVYEQLAQKCDYALHLGLTEAGTGTAGTVASAAALGILLQQGIGDTIRVSITPQPRIPRTQEVTIARALLQSLSLRHFAPSIISCPGCGRTDRNYFQKINARIRAHIESVLPKWQKLYPGFEHLKIAIMGCVVNGPGESRHADIGISLPGAAEKISAPVFIGGNRVAVLQGKNIERQFIRILEKYLKNRFGASR